MIFILNFRETTNIIQERNFVKWFFLFFLIDTDFDLVVEFVETKLTL